MLSSAILQVGNGYFRTMVFDVMSGFDITWRFTACRIFAFCLYIFVSFGQENTFSAAGVSVIAGWSWCNSVMTALRNAFGKFNSFGSELNI